MFKTSKPCLCHAHIISVPEVGCPLNNKLFSTEWELGISVAITETKVVKHLCLFYCERCLRELCDISCTFNSQLTHDYLWYVTIVYSLHQYFPMSEAHRCAHRFCSLLYSCIQVTDCSYADRCFIAINFKYILYWQMFWYLLIIFSFVFWRSRVKISVRKSTMLTEVFCCFSSSSRQKPG